MNLTLQRRLAARVLKVGESKIWLDPSELEEISKAITKNDIRGLIAQGVIKAKKLVGVSRGRARTVEAQRRKGRKRGYGSRKGRASARTPEKKTWMNKIRSLRRLAKAMKTSGDLNNAQYRAVYLKAKGNFFRSRAHLKIYVDKLKEK